MEGKSLAELTEILANLKHDNGSAMHNKTDVIQQSVPYAQ